MDGWLGRFESFLAERGLADDTLWVGGLRSRRGPLPLRLDRPRYLHARGPAAHRLDAQGPGRAGRSADRGPAGADRRRDADASRSRRAAGAGRGQRPLTGRLLATRRLPSARGVVVLRRQRLRREGDGAGRLSLAVQAALAEHDGTAGSSTSPTTRSRRSSFLVAARTPRRCRARRHGCRRPSSAIGGRCRSGSRSGVRESAPPSRKRCCGRSAI